MFVPSPINKSINLLFGNQIGVRQNENIEIEKILLNLDLKPQKDKNCIPSMLFTQLSGYPFIDINVNYIFNLIPPEIVLEVFIFSFLEYNIIFYSSKLDILNMIMYIFKCFNYPFNDLNYYQYILSVSQEKFKSGTSSFIDKKFPTMTGILSEYDPEIQTTEKIGEHFVLDIDKKNFFFLYKEKNDEIEDIISLHNYIKNCSIAIFNYENYHLRHDEEKLEDGIHLYESIKSLMEELNKISRKVTAIDYNFSKWKPHFFNLYKNESEIECIKSNNKILEAFYIFIIKIIRPFLILNNYEGEGNSSDSEYIPESRVPSFVINIEEENIQMEDKIPQINEKSQLAIKSGQVFREKFMNTSKYNSFVIKFYNHGEANDANRIPYNFINEFIYYYQLSFSRNLNEIQIFKLIDQFYGNKELLDFEEIANKKLEIFYKEKTLEQKEKERKEKEKRKEKERREKEKRKEKEKREKKEREEKAKREKKEKREEKEKEKERREKEKDINFLMNSKMEEEEFQNIYLFSFDNFSEYYDKNLRTIINREQEDDKENFTKVKSINRMYKRYKRNNYFLSQKILNIYITFTNNNIKELLKTFELVKWTYIKPENSSININNIVLEGDSKKINEEINYFQLFKKKYEDRKILNEKLFRTYNIIDIEDFIESQFILQRYFSPYEIIEYSLLNVLAVTRFIERKSINNKNVMKIIFDFCDITKLENKKYMNIYLNIFKSIHQAQNEELIKKFEIEECLKIISFYFNKKNINLAEENKTYINNLKSSQDSSEIIENNPLDCLIKNKEKIFNQNNSKKVFEEALKAIETIYLGEYEKSLFKFNYNYNNNLMNNKFIPKTPILLYDSTNKILHKYLTDFSNENISYNDLYNDVLSLLFYFEMPNIGNKWIKKSEKQRIDNEKKLDFYPESIEAKKGEESNSIKKKESIKWEILGLKENKSDLIGKKSDIKENYNILNKMLNKIIDILFDLIYNIKDKRKFQ